jgi:uncharacterized NAD-dependent epimerase/dehydratase family protein
VEINRAPFAVKGRRVILLTDGELSTFGSKTAVCYLRYRNADVVAVVDPAAAGQTVEGILGFGGPIPITATIADAAAYHPEIVIIGVAPRGGQLTQTLRVSVLRGLEAGLDTVSGLHTFLGDDLELAAAAAESGARIWDVRRVPEVMAVGSGLGCTTGARTVLVAGTDCNVGKMTATVELYREAKRRGLKAAWAATGQTGMMLRERGITVDRVIGDFISGAAETLVNFEGSGHDLVFVEGQGSLVHPGYASVALGLLYGVMPDCIVMVHAATKHTIANSDVALPSVVKFIAMHRTLLEPFKESPVAGICVNTSDVEPSQARVMMEALERETGLPVCDPVSDGAGLVLDAVVKCVSRK